MVEILWVEERVLIKGKCRVFESFWRLREKGLLSYLDLLIGGIRLGSEGVRLVFEKFIYLHFIINFSKGYANI